jgi:hypothetical protein
VASKCFAELSLGRTLRKSIGEIAMPRSCEELAKEFDTLSQDQIVPAGVYDVLRNQSRETRRRKPPPLRRIQFSAKLYGYRVGDLRKLIRGELVAS